MRTDNSVVSIVWTLRIAKQIFDWVTRRNNQRIAEVQNGLKQLNITPKTIPDIHNTNTSSRKTNNKR